MRAASIRLRRPGRGMFRAPRAVEMEGVEFAGVAGWADEGVGDLHERAAAFGQGDGDEDGEFLASSSSAWR